MRIELFVKESYRFCSNPLKDEVKAWIFAVFFVLVFVIMACNVLRALW